MDTNFGINQIEKFEFTVQRITILHYLLSRAKKGLVNKFIDKIRDAIYLVNICLTIGDLLLQKDKYIIDIDLSIKRIHDTYATVFNIKPNGRYYVNEAGIPVNGPLEDLLVPVIQI